MCEGQWAQLRRQGKGDQKVRTRQQASLLLCQPALGLVTMTLGTVPIATGVIGINLPAAVVTLFQVAAKVGRTTRLNILQGPRLTGQQLVLSAIGRTMAAEDLRHLQHAKPPAKLRGLAS